MKKNLPELLKAIDKLIDHYSDYGLEDIPPQYEDVEDNGCCPLCDFRDEIHYRRTKLSPRNTCEICPWGFFEKQWCYFTSYSRDTTADRLDRLNRWKKRLER